jgi:hypothetical protein
MRFSDVKAFLEPQLAAAALPAVISPGPATDEALHKLSPQRTVFVSIGSGAGFSKEATFDRPLLTVRTIGKQRNYDDGERLAWFVDSAFFIESPRDVGTVRVLYVTRSGGSPTLLLRDSADRYHFTCSYITETATGY